MTKGVFLLYNLWFKALEVFKALKSWNNALSLFYDRLTVEMFIKIADLDDEGFRLSIDSSSDLSDKRSKKEELALRESLLDINIKVGKDLKGTLSLDKSKDVLTVEGHIKTSVSFLCSRCLIDLEETIDSDFKDVFLIKEFEVASEGEELEITGREIGSDYIASGNIDTNDFFIEQVALRIPQRPLCKDECKGLCPSCGVNLNKEDCGCKKEDRVDPRFAGLKDFKVK